MIEFADISYLKKENKMDYVVTLRNDLDFLFSFKWSGQLPSWLHYRAVQVIELKKDHGLVTKDRYNIPHRRCTIEEFKSLKPVNETLENIFEKIGMKWTKELVR